MIEKMIRRRMKRKEVRRSRRQRSENLCATGDVKTQYVKIGATEHQPFLQF